MGSISSLCSLFSPPPLKVASNKGARLAQLVKPVTPDLKVMSSSLTLGSRGNLEKKKKKANHSHNNQTGRHFQGGSRNSSMEHWEASNRLA